MTPDEEQQLRTFVNLIIDRSIEQTRKGYRLIDGEEVRCFDDNRKRIINNKTREFHKKDRIRVKEWSKLSPEEQDRRNLEAIKKF